MPKSARRKWTDAEMLEALDLRDHGGLSGGAIAAQLLRSRSSVLAMMNRIDQETDASDPNNIGDGTMPARWWKRPEK
jgi:hypothetical protein